MSVELTEVEAARLRQILAEHDSQHKPLQIHDLNNPPKVQYIHQKFPMMVYDLEHSQPAHVTEEVVRVKGVPYKPGDHVPAQVISKIVRSEDELQDALAKGWSEKGPEFREEERAEPLSAAYQEEAERTQQRIEATQRHRGRRSRGQSEAA